ncbi:MAG: hypothetical protein PVSMB9_07800 [Candidatus Dormibacteria bacterium]
MEDRLIALGYHGAEAVHPTHVVDAVHLAPLCRVTKDIPASPVEVATIWHRARAIILDLIVLSILQVVINLTFGSERITNAIVDPSTSGGFSSFSSTTEVDGFWLWLVAIAYFSILEGLFGATLGKLAVGLRVTDIAGRNAGWRSILIRNVARVIDSFPGFYLVGALAMRFSERSQRVGDRWAGTLVVPTRVALGARLTTEQRRWRQGLVIAVAGAFLIACGVFSYFGRPPIALNGMALTGQFPGGRASNLQHGSARWNGGSVTYPVSYTQVGTGKSCNGSITLDWHGFLEGWIMSSAQSTC